MVRIVILSAILVLATACDSERVDRTEPPRGGDQPRTTPPPTMAQRYGFEIVKRIPHEVTAFTQGLTVHNGAFIESTGQYGMSSLRRVNMSTGAVLQSIGLGQQFFGEGSTVLNGKIYVITWLNQQGFIYDAETLKETGTFRYAGEGWGLATDRQVLYMSNGTNMIVVRDPGDLHIVGSISVTMDGSPLRDLNELEWIDGELWANVWRTDLLVRIDPKTGVVTGVVDLTGILPQSERSATTDVLNGIAYDAKTKTIYVTGKNWPWIYQIRIT
jgi:glutamine cyclotransferase